MERISSYICWMPDPLVQCSPLFLSNQIQLYKPSSTGIAGVILSADARAHPATGAPRAMGTEHDPLNSHPDSNNALLHPQLTEAVGVLFQLWLILHFPFFIMQDVAANTLFTALYKPCSRKYTSVKTQLHLLSEGKAPCSWTGLLFVIRRSHAKDEVCKLKETLAYLNETLLGKNRPA